MKKLKNIFYLILTLFVLSFFLYKIFHRALSDYLLRNNPEVTKAVIINEKNILPNSYVTFPFSYSYEFKLNGKSYENDSHDTTLKIGDTIEVEYYKNWPSFNKAKNPKE